MNIQVIGAGSWGLALARLLALNGHQTSLWCRDEDKPDELRDTRHSAFFLRDVAMPDNLDVVREVDPDVDIAVFAVPSHVMRIVAKQYPLSANTIRVSVAKGIENESLLRMSEVIREVSGDCTVVSLSGPSHAEEVAHDLPASLVAAGEHADACLKVQEAFTAKTFRVYTSPDIIGVELGGSLKNVIAIAAGMSDGFGLGDNAKAALITRGLAEMARLGVALGADPLTFAGLSGMGDLIVTCASLHSRNRGLGEQLASGKTYEEITAGSHMVVEGVRTAQSSVALAGKQGIEIPIAEQVGRILFDGADPRAAVDTLMQRAPKPERA
jgi:glycerol-3-phosphate dehydrogenase (NAD(P)+)